MILHFLDNKFLYQLVGHNIKISNKYFNNSELFIDNKINKINNIINNDINYIYNLEDIFNESKIKIDTFNYIYILLNVENHVD